MKIYFAGSIRGGRDDKEIYYEIITLLSKYGQVLTEHIGDQKLSEYGEKNMTDEEIFTRDVNWIKESDIIIAENTSPSTGVGWELAHGESLNKKIISLYRENPGKRLYAMISGNNYIKKYTYEKPSDLVTLFDKMLK